MASVARSDPKLRKPFPKPLMLKDFLSDDMSSCSSNGFKSFPRRHCCTTVRYLVEKDFKAKDSTKARRLLRKSRSKAAASTTISALQRASEAVINAVKLLPFSSVKAPSFSVKNRSRKGILPRSFSRKLLKRKFWKRTAVEEEIEIERWKSFHDFLEEKQKSSSHIRHHSTTTTTIDSTSATSNSNSWSDGEFTLDYLQFSSCNSVSSGENDAVSRKKYLPEKMVSKRVGVAVGGDSMEATSTTCSEKKEKEWPNEEEKEQFSPVSVLDCPFEDEDEDEDEEMCSPFQHRVTHMEGTKQKLLQKIRRFESVAELEPVDLEKRIALLELDDEPLHQSPAQPSMSIHRNKEEMTTERQAQNLLKLIKAEVPSDSSKFNAGTLLLDFFKERIMERHENPNADEFNQELLRVTEDWMSGHHRDFLLGWEVQNHRKAYIKDMEERGKWRKLEEEKEEVAAEVENEILTYLLNEMFFELSTT